MTLRLAIVSDFRAEGWPSMDLCAEELLGVEAADGASVSEIDATFRRLWTRIPVLGRSRAFRNADRARNRYTLLPRHLRGVAGDFDAFHVVDHSYAHVVHVLPAGRTGVFCHDLDAFRCLLDPARDLRPRWFRALARRTLAGLQRAAIVFVATKAVARELLERGLVEASRVVHAPLGVSSEFTAITASGADSPSWLGGLAQAPFLLHVGSAIPRKRIDVLLDVFATLRAARPGLQLVKVGGEWTRAQREQMVRLGIEGAVVHALALSRRELAAVYRRAAVVLVTSEAEGFGLPVIEASACGAPVVASDIPALRESGGAVARYSQVGDVGAWVSAVERVLFDGWSEAATRERVAWAGRFTWEAHARTIFKAYRERLGG